MPSDVTELPAQYHRVVDDLRRRYVVGYTSSHLNAMATGEPCRIESRALLMRRCAARVDTSHLDSEPAYLKLERTVLYANFWRR